MCFHLRDIGQRGSWHWNKELAVRVTAMAAGGRKRRRGGKTERASSSSLRMNRRLSPLMTSRMSRSYASGNAVRYRVLRRRTRHDHQPHERLRTASGG